MADDLTQASATDDKGRTLSGVGVSVDDLQDTIDARQPAPEHKTPLIAPAASASVSSPTATAPTSTEPPQLAKGRARYQELTHERDEAKARADAAEKKAAELEARLQPPPARVEGPLGTATPAPVAGESAMRPAAPSSPSQPAQAAPTRPKPSIDDIGGKYTDWDTYQEDFGRWVWEQQQQTIQQQIAQGIQQHQQQQQFVQHVESVRAKGRAAYPDFDQMLQSGPGTFVAMHPAAIQAILNHPQSEHVQYQIMKDGALAQRLAQLAGQNPYAFALELVKLAPQAQAGSAVPSQVAPPAPMQPVGSGSRTSTPGSADAENFEQYQARRRAERKARG